MSKEVSEPLSNLSEKFDIIEGSSIGISDNDAFKVIVNNKNIYYKTMPLDGPGLDTSNSDVWKIDSIITKRYLNENKDIWSDVLEGLDEPTVEIKCECGAEKAKTTHARWCDKYRD